MLRDFFHSILKENTDQKPGRLKPRLHWQAFSLVGNCLSGRHSCPLFSTGEGLQEPVLTPESIAAQVPS